MKRYLLLAIAVVLVTTLGMVSRVSALPLPPAGLPEHFGFGLFARESSSLPAGVPVDYQYQYLSAGVNTGYGWSTWNSGGTYASRYVNNVRSRGSTPVFIYYNILQSAPHYDEYRNLQDAAVMRAYYDDFKLLMVRLNEVGGVIPVNIEPDLTGVMQQHSTNVGDNAALQPAKVSASGHPDVQGIPDTFRGVYQALAHLRDRYAPNVLLGLDASVWGATHDITLQRSEAFDWQTHARRTANYLNSLGPGFQLVFFSPLDRDAAFYQIQYGSNRWWDDTNQSQPTFNRMRDWIGLISSVTDKRVLMWQVPEGNRLYRSVNNTKGHYQDNRAEYFLNPESGRRHIQEWMDAGVIGLMFGAGVGSQTHHFDAMGDGITNPEPINGNTVVAEYADDDGGYIRIRLGAYYAEGVMPLPGSSTPPPTVQPTPTLAPTPPPTVQPTPTPNPTPPPTVQPTPTPEPTPSIPPGQQKPKKNPK
jgi:hypothetical protein